MKTRSHAPKNAETIRILKTETCPSLSGKTTLTYEIGCSPSSDICVRICESSGSGYFSGDWVTWNDLLKVLGKSTGKPITSFSLHPLFEGRSVNTAGFLLAMLKHERLVQPMADKKRCYECLDGSAFIKEVQGLMKGAPAKGAPAKGATPKKPAIKSAAAKARSSKK